MFWLPVWFTPGRFIFVDPLKLTPPIVLAVVRVAADPVVFWLSVGTLAAFIVPEEILLAFKEVKLAPEPLNVVAENVPVNVPVLLLILNHSVNVPVLSKIS